MFTWRPTVCKLRDALGGHYPVNTEIHLKPILEGIRYAIAIQDQRKLVVNFQAVWKWTGDNNQAALELYFEGSNWGKLNN